MHVECEQHADRKLLEAWITLDRLDRALRGIEIPRHPSERSTTAYFTSLVL